MVTHKNKPASKKKKKKKNVSRVFKIILNIYFYKVKTLHATTRARKMDGLPCDVFYISSQVKDLQIWMQYIDVTEMPLTG